MKINFSLPICLIIASATKRETKQLLFFSFDTASRRRKYQWVALVDSTYHQCQYQPSNTFAGFTRDIRAKVIECTEKTFQFGQFFRNGRRWRRWPRMTSGGDTGGDACHGQTTTTTHRWCHNCCDGGWRWRRWQRTCIWISRHWRIWKRNERKRVEREGKKKKLEKQLANKWTCDRLQCWIEQDGVMWACVLERYKKDEDRIRRANLIENRVCYYRHQSFPLYAS